MPSLPGTRFDLGMTARSGVDLRTEGILPAHGAQRRFDSRWPPGEGTAVCATTQMTQLESAQTSAAPSSG